MWKSGEVIHKCLQVPSKYDIIPANEEVLIMDKLKANIEHFVEYYLLETVLITAVVIALISIVYTIATQEDTEISFHIIKENLDTEQINEFTHNVKTEFIKEDSPIVIQSINSVSDQSEMNVGILYQKLSADIQIREVDIILIDESALENFQYYDELYDLSRLESFEHWQGKTYQQTDDQEVIIGLDLSDHPFFEPISDDDQPLVFTVINNSLRLEIVDQFINFINNY